MDVSQALSRSARECVQDARIFVVGAGGIGCELIKNLVLVGFKNIEIIDLDTIDVSNLNRQFLFQKKHVGRSKAEVARENAVKLRPDVNIVSHHASIFNQDFNTQYFRQFDIVLNALDNRAARNHVNRLCLAAGVPLVESGSAGYLGQVNIIKKGVTECYECSPKPRQKTYPGCTIRNTPSELIHCVVWAKYLFNQLFGEEDADEDVSPDTADPEAALTNADTDRVSTRLWAKENEYEPEKIFNKLFNRDIEYLLSMEKLWTKRTPPKPVLWCVSATPANYTTSSQNVTSLEENIAIFSQSITNLKEKLKSESGDGVLVWDKDDDDAMAFVAAGANIRAQVFGIAQKSIFEIKRMAGNIIPAIATTNAMVAGLIVMQALCILQDEFSRCKNVFISRFPNPTKKLIAPCVLDPPQTSCYVCSSKPEVTVKLNVETFTLGDLKEKVLKSQLGMLAPDVDDGFGTLLLSSEEGESDDNLPKSLLQMNVKHGLRLVADDFQQNFQLILNVFHTSDLADGNEFEVVTHGEIPAPTEDEPQQSVQDPQEESDDDLVVIEGNGTTVNDEKDLHQDEKESQKRKLPSASGDDDVTEFEQPSKRIKTNDYIQIIE